MADFWAGGKFLNTASAQLAVLPLLLINFGNFIIFSSGKYFDFRSDSLTMSLGFLTVLSDFLIHPIFNFRMVYGNYSDLRTYNH